MKILTNRRVCLFVILAAAGVPSRAWGDSVPLGTAQRFAVLAGSTVTNTGATVVHGDVGVWPGLAITGFPPGLVVGGALHSGDAIAHQAQLDVTTAYNSFASMAASGDLTGQDLGGMTLTPGVYRFSSSAQLTGRLTLNAMGNPNALFVFQMGSSLTTASSSSVLSINGADGCNVYWQVGSSATLGTDTAFEGNILSLTSITLNTRASISEGRALARNGAVTMDTNSISNECLEMTGVPLPGAASMGAAGLVLVGAAHRRRRGTAGPTPAPLPQGPSQRVVELVTRVP